MVHPKHLLIDEITWTSKTSFGSLRPNLNDIGRILLVRYAEIWLAVLLVHYLTIRLLAKDFYEVIEIESE